jgi:hypothetical protein
MTEITQEEIDASLVAMGVNPHKGQPHNEACFQALVRHWEKHGKTPSTASLAHDMGLSYMATHRALRDLKFDCRVARVGTGLGTQWIPIVKKRRAKK